MTLDAIRDRLPEPAKDLKLNLQSTLEQGSLTVSQRWGVAVASAITSRNAALTAAVLEEAAQHVDAATLADARAAAALMGMNNILYRFRHMIGKPEYGSKQARLRMNRLAAPASSKADLELFSLAASAITGCEACVRAHERVVLEAGMTEDNVFDAIRIASTVHGVAVALEMGGG
jgi:lipoyl-dependent peroxiredoxin subunit D